MILLIKLLKIWTVVKCCNYPKTWFYHTEVCSKDADKMTYNKEPDQIVSLTLVYSV